MWNWCRENPWFAFVLFVLLINMASELVRYICIAVSGQPIPWK